MRIFQSILRFGLGWGIVQVYLNDNIWTAIVLTLLILYVIGLPHDEGN